MLRRPRQVPLRASQGGAMLLIVMVVLVSLTYAALSLFRSADVGVLLTANLSFKRDAQNQAGIALNEVVKIMSASTFSSTDPLYCSDSAHCSGGNTLNLSMRLLSADPKTGVPLIMLKDTDLSAGASSFDALFKATVATNSSAKLYTRYLIERMCDGFIAATSQDCQSGQWDKQGGSHQGAGTSGGGGTPASVLPFYRVTVRVDGPRNTRAYAQTIVSLN